MKSDHRAIVAGAGPAGLTAARCLLEAGITPQVFEADSVVGGISRTVNHHGNRIDIGGHRFFTKHPEIEAIWREVLPEGEPESGDDVMMTRNRQSRIIYRHRFFDYPVSLSLKTLAAMGLWNSMRTGAGYIAARISPRRETTLEDFYINRFGAPLYHMFFENYTAKVWGRHPRELRPDWGAQRVKGVSIAAVVRDSLARSLGIRHRVETSLITQFKYPKFGPGSLWEAMARRIVLTGGILTLDTAVSGIHVDNNRVVGVTVSGPDGDRRLPCDSLFSSMPLQQLSDIIEGIEIPAEVADTCARLPYRDFITVGLLLDKPCRLPDNWIYIHEPGVKAGRLQVFNNWSPYMVADSDFTTWLGLEYFCNRGDGLWEMSDGELVTLAADELRAIGLGGGGVVTDSAVIRMPQAYPAYFGSYDNIMAVRRFLDSIDGLYCIGRNGQHRYNNMDHSMLTAIEAVRLMTAGLPSGDTLWNVNSEEGYHEAKE